MVKLNKSNKGRLSFMLICFILLACSKTKQEDRSIKTIPSLYGKWQMIDWNGEGYLSLDISLDFNKNGEFTDSRSGDAIWNYQYINPDSLILYHHGTYEERYKILTLSGDSLIIELSESLFHTEENGKEISAEYGKNKSKIFKFIRK